MPSPRLPLDHPYPGRPFRLYAALTNRCDRGCPWCSTHSRADGRTNLDPAVIPACLPVGAPCEIQLEGGEPTLHPRFWDIVSLCRGLPDCRQLILCTNGALLPRDPNGLLAWVERLGPRLTVKLSINHHLLGLGPDLFALARTLAGIMASGAGDRNLVLNVRLRPGRDEENREIEARVAAAGLSAQTNQFFLQAYGRAERESTWEKPFLAGNNFNMLNPDGRLFGTDLIARSRDMGALP